MERIEKILAYWFSELDDTKHMDSSLPLFLRWFGKNETTDREIRELFEGDLIRAAQGEYRQWENTSKGRLALVILLDQFPRNMYRGPPGLLRRTRLL